MGKDCGEVDWSWDNPAVVERFTKYFNDWQRQQQQKQHDLNEVGKQDFLRTKIRTLVNQTVNQILTRCSKPRSELQTLTKLFYRELKKASGSYLGEATSEQLQVSWDYLIGLYNEIISGRIPPWAR
jgi:hypothetical protein